MDPILLASIVNGIFQLAQAGIERSAIIDRLQGVPPEKYPDILDALMAEAKAARDAAIGAAPE
jgi:hypothetical protein